MSSVVEVQEQTGGVALAPAQAGSVSGGSSQTGSASVSSPQSVGVSLTSLQIAGVEVIEQGPKGDPGAPVVTATAAQAISGETVVIVRADGTMVPMDVTNLAIADSYPFLTTVAVASGAQATLFAAGAMTESFWNWAPNLAIFLGPNGSLTQVVPSLPTSLYLIKLAVALTPTTIYYDPQPPLILG